MTRRTEIEHLLRAGQRIRSRMLDVKRLQGNTASGHVRVAILVPRHGHTAVQRNTLKRRLRELARLHMLNIGRPWDVMLRARRDTYGASFAELRDEVQRIAAVLESDRADAAEA